MVVGNGLIAKGFEHYRGREDIILFASGVSNSRETDERLYKRETDLLKDTTKDLGDKTFIYFSTCSIYDKDSQKTKYVQHKKEIEKLVSSFSNYHIFRLPQVVGNSNNKHQLFNFLVDVVKNQQKFNLFKNAYRNFIDIDDIRKVVDSLIPDINFKNKTINIANTEAIAIVEVIKKIESFLEREGNYEVIESGGRYDIDIREIEPVIKKVGIEFGYDYFDKLLIKYKRGC